MVSVTEQHRSCGTPEKIVELARQWARRAVFGIVRESGGRTVARPVFRGRPDLDTTVTENESLGGLQAAVQLKHAAMRLTLEYARQAREDGHSSQEIGVALSLVHLAESDISVAGAAYDYAVGTTDLGRASFAWVCPACRGTVLEHGPEAGHPADCEYGHADDCTRLATVIAAWDNSWDDEARH